jgi:hypothetical protein
VTRALIEHWNGRKWSLIASPSVARSPDTSLFGVSCSDRLGCWAVGGATLRSAREEPITEHWNGSKWSLTVLPEPASLAAADLTGVWCPDATRCWAVGAAARRVNTASRPLAEHWTGKKWSVVPARASGSASFLYGVFCRQDADCWAVGGGGIYGLAEHWNGRRWSVAATPRVAVGMTGVWCSGKDCFGTGTGGFPSATAERWTGKKWSLSPIAPFPPGVTSGLPGVSCAAAINCFAVGFASVRTLIEHWQGSKWVKVKSPNPAGAQFADLGAVFCLSPRACWAVGESGSTGPTSTLAEHWNGRSWSIVRTP